MIDLFITKYFVSCSTISFCNRESWLMTHSWRAIMLARVRLDSKRLRALCAMRITQCSRAASALVTLNLCATTRTTNSILRHSERVSYWVIVVHLLCRQRHWTTYNFSTHLSHMIRQRMSITLCLSRRKTFNRTRVVSLKRQHRPHRVETGRLTLPDNKMLWDHPNWKRRVNHFR